MGIPWLSSGEDSVPSLLGSGFNPGGELRFHKPRGKVKKEENSVTPMDCSLPGSCAHGIFQARILEWVAISYSRGISTLGWNPSLLHYLYWQILYHWATWKAPEDFMLCKVSHLQEAPRGIASIEV